jgi:hypothetical protein
MFLFTQHGLKRNAAFTSLVELGPAALPLLLASLDDKTPTKLVIGHYGFIGSMWLSHEISGNPLNSREAKLLADVKSAGEESFFDQRDLGRYTVKVGDICFVAVGQIANRAYAAVRYQPSGCIVVNSTVEDKKLAAEVRAIWGSADQRRKLLDSLLLDFHGQGQFGVFQTGAVMRLAYYFPDAAEDLIIARLNELEAAAAGKPQENAGVEAEELVGAVSWSKSPRLKAKLLEMFRKTADPKTFLAAMQAVGKEHDELVFRRITEQLDALAGNEPGPFGHGYSLLLALGNRFPGRAEKAFHNYLKPGTVERRRTVTHVLRETCGDLAIPLLKSLLEDKRAVGEAFNPQGNGPRYPIRVCDEAAETIAMHSKTLKFDAEGIRENSDRQIEVMRRKIAEGQR